MCLIVFITVPASVRQIRAHAGELATVPAIAPVRSPPVEVNAQQLIAPEAVEAIPELSLTRRQTWQRKLDTIGWWLMRVRVRMRMQTAALRGAYTRRDIYGHSSWRASSGCLFSRKAGVAGGCAWLPSSQSQRRCDR